MVAQTALLHYNRWIVTAYISIHFIIRHYEACTNAQTQAYFLGPLEHEFRLHGNPVRIWSTKR